jgi:predicted alpha/beta hydrolase family esterase
MHPAPARLLIIPGLHDSGPAHWQTWLQAQYGHARRVVQRDFSRPELTRWSERIQRTLESAAPGPWVAVAHSFGVLALAQHLAEHPDSPIREALLVAPAEPDRFGLAESLPRHRLPRPLQLVTSSNDPWMGLASAHRWAQRWGASVHHLGAAGHINTEAGFGPWPLARHWVDEALQRVGCAEIAQAA